MRRTTVHGLMLALLAGAPAAGCAADEYWGYSYRNIDVTAAGNSAYAVNLVQACIRMDAMLSHILGIQTSYRAPTHIFSMPTAQLKRFVGARFSSSYRTSGYDNTVLMDDSADATGRHYWGAYFGYIATLLASEQALSGPDWYQVGVPAVFADTVFEGPHAKLGNITPGYAYTLTTAGTLIPMRTFLGLRQHDAELKGERYLNMYDAEAWYLAREIFVEGLHRAEVGKYLDLMRQGTAEPAAFAASFTISYEQLDKELLLGMRDQAHVYIVEAPEEPDAARGTPQRLSAAEVQGRYALAAVRYGEGPDPRELADAALRLDATNETALRALALAQLKKGAYTEALAAVDKLAAQGESLEASADSAGVLAGLADAAARGEAKLPVDAASLRARAQQEYRRVLAADGEDRRARFGLARLTDGR